MIGEVRDAGALGDADVGYRQRRVGRLAVVGGVVATRVPHVDRAIEVVVDAVGALSHAVDRLARRARSRRADAAGIRAGQLEAVLAAGTRRIARANAERADAAAVAEPRSGDLRPGLGAGAVAGVPVDVPGDDDTVERAGARSATPAPRPRASSTFPRAARPRARWRRMRPGSELQAGCDAALGTFRGGQARVGIPTSVSRSRRRSARRRWRVIDADTSSPRDDVSLAMSRAFPAFLATVAVAVLVSTPTAPAAAPSWHEAGARAAAARTVIQGRVYEDRDASGGGLGRGDRGLNGWRVWVDRNGNGRWDRSEPSAISRERKGLPGHYTLRVRATGSQASLRSAPCRRRVRALAGRLPPLRRTERRDRRRLPAARQPEARGGGRGSQLRLVPGRDDRGLGLRGHRRRWPARC